MRKPKDIEINGKRLDVILEEHMYWQNENIVVYRDMCVDLYHADLYDADLRGANLCGACLHYADMRGANLHGVNLQDSDLYRVNLRRADLRCADLKGANLYDADLKGADLRGAILYGANLSNANLYHADLHDADLRGANLCGAILRDTNGDLIQYRKGKILTESIIGYKKCKHDIIITLEIPRGAIVFSINGDKCRTNKAKVIAIDGANRAYSIINNTSYYIGDEFTIYNFDCEYNTECASGIHFFMTKEKAIEYKY